MSLKWAGVPDRCKHGQYEDKCQICAEYARGYKAGIKVGAREAFERERERRVELIEQLHRAERERAEVREAEASRFLDDDQEAPRP